MGYHICMGNELIVFVLFWEKRNGTQFYLSLSLKMNVGTWYKCLLPYSSGSFKIAIDMLLYVCVWEKCYHVKGRMVVLSIWNELQFIHRPFEKFYNSFSLHLLSLCLYLSLFLCLFLSLSLSVSLCLSLSLCLFLSHMLSVSLSHIMGICGLFLVGCFCFISNHLKINWGAFSLYIYVYHNMLYVCIYLFVLIYRWTRNVGKKKCGKVGVEEERRGGGKESLPFFSSFFRFFLALLVRPSIYVCSYPSIYLYLFISICFSNWKQKFSLSLKLNVGTWHRWL